MYLNITSDKVGKLIVQLHVVNYIWISTGYHMKKCINQEFNKAVCLLKNSRKTVENVISIELSFISVYEVICLLIKQIF